MSIKTMIKKAVPKSLWNFVRHYRAITWDRVTNLGSAHCHIPYCGFNLSYSAGTILVKKIRNGKIFEEEMCKSIASELEKHPSPVFLDIGANIGLVSLYVLSKVPGVKIHAFEPGPDQNKRFGETIKENNISNISLSNKAVGEKEEQKTFVTHFSPDSSGDGFVDTGRAGEPTSIIVDVTTLDSWWNKVGRSKIHVMKIDIEGAELLALRGGAEFLKGSRPLIYLEIEPKNLKVYPHTKEDIFKWFKEHSYGIEQFSNDTFIAKPLQ